MENLIHELRKFREDRNWNKYHSPKNLVMALMIEAAELAEHFQWLTQEESINLPTDKREKIKDEIGDVIIYIANLSDRLGIDPLKAACDKLEKNKLKYPVDKARGNSLKYNEYG